MCVYFRNTKHSVQGSFFSIYFIVSGIGWFILCIEKKIVLIAGIDVGRAQNITFLGIKAIHRRHARTDNGYIRIKYSLF